MKLANVAGAAAAVALLSSTAAPADGIDRPAATGLNDGLIREAAAAVRHGAHRTAASHGQPVATVHHGPQGAGVHHGLQGAAVHRVPQRTFVRGRPGHPRPYPPGHPVAAYRPAYHPAYQPAYHPVVRQAAPATPPAAAAWTRPKYYSWSPGGAVAAGSAIGFLTAEAVKAWAPPPPQPGLCWYYKDPGQKSGFWDVCP